VLGGPPECPTRPFCQVGLEKTYGLHFDGFVSLDAGGPLSKTALKQGKVQPELDLALLQRRLRERHAGFVSPGAGGPRAKAVLQGGRAQPQLDLALLQRRLRERPAGFVSLDAGGPLTKTALKQGKVQLGLVFSSDGSLSPSS